MEIRTRKPWEIVPSSEATPEGVFLNRRQLLRAAALGAGAAFLHSHARDASGPFSRSLADEKPNPYPAKRNEKFALDRPITDEAVAGKYNNFYEFTTVKDKVCTLVDKFEPEPWKVEISGLCAKPATFDLDDLRKIAHEERLYRFRCVETWAMAVPWVGFPMWKLLEKVEPKSEAKYVRFVSFNKPEWCPGLKTPETSHYPWPYFEGLTIEEAKNELALFATGIYGHALPKQHGAPIRAVVPWKYGYKSAKSIVKIELVASKPETFWHQANPEEYGFFSNVNPDVPHPRWSQAGERLIDTGERRDTVIYNGYGEYVADLYKGMNLSKPGN